MSVSASVSSSAIERLELDPPRAVEALELRRAACAAGGGDGARRSGSSAAASPARAEGCARGSRRTSASSDRPSADPRGPAPTGVSSLSRSSSSSNPSNSRTWAEGSLPSATAALLVEPRQQRRELSAAAAAERAERRMAGPHEWPQRPDQRRVGELTVGLLDGLPTEHERLRPRIGSGARTPGPAASCRRRTRRRAAPRLGDCSAASRKASSSSASSPTRPTKRLDVTLARM